MALHGLGLDSSSYTGLAKGVAELGLRTLAVDLPGFGGTPLPGVPLTPAALAEPVLDLARRLDEKPIVMGMSLGGRVALEAALLAPELFRGAVMLGTPLPRRRHRWVLTFARLLSPEIAARIRVEAVWPWLKRRADRLEDELTGEARHDWFLRASKRAIYYISCPATRWAFVSAARELALDPAYGPHGLWTRLEQLRIPAAFVWGDQDRFVPMEDVPLLAEVVPHAVQIHVPCAGHWENGPHFRCMERAAIDAVNLVDMASRRSGRVGRARQRRRTVAECRVGPDERAAAVGAPAREEA